DLFLGCEIAAQDWLDLHDSEVSVTNAHRRDAFRLADPREYRTKRLISGHVFEHRVLTLPVGDVGSGDLAAVVAFRREVAPDQHYAVGLIEGQGFEQNCVNYAENCGISSNTESK